jgi:hypothetical protein
MKDFLDFVRGEGFNVIEEVVTLIFFPLQKRGSYYLLKAT